MQVNDMSTISGNRDQLRNEQILLGQRLRELRKARSMSMRDLAHSAGVSLGYISQIEKGTANVSVRLLRQLADVFGIEWIDLYQPDSPAGRILRRADRPTFSPGGGQVHHAITRPPLLDLEVGVVDYQPGATVGDETYTHGDVHEIFLVLKGRFLFALAGDEFEMEAGDSVDFRSSVPHMLTSLGPETGEGLWIATPPTGRSPQGLFVPEVGDPDETAAQQKTATTEKR